jgi:hypothetical protein
VGRNASRAAAADGGGGISSGGLPAGGVTGESGEAGAEGGSASHRPSRNHRYMVSRLGARAGPPASRARKRRMTDAGLSPAANASSASRRREAHEYDPGRSRGGGADSLA